MGLLGNLFGKDDMPELGSEVPVYSTIQGFQKHLKVLTENIPGDMELVPYEDKVYVFIGKPPKQFGFAWIDDKYVNNLIGVAKEKGISKEDLGKISEDLRQTYIKNKDSMQKYIWNADDARMIVNVSDGLGQQLKTIVDNI
ncbi:MAG: hypothetical protein JSV21_08000 [Nitrospirota bacterium]|nr:MAG: hypothetical protein JSV21_08000 [Nitrospirota bacterium]